MEPHDLDLTTLPPPPLQARRIVVFGGGRAGVGKATLSTNLAVYFAQLGKRSLLVDADHGGGANLHAQLGLSLPAFDRAEEREPEPLPTSVQGLQFLPLEMSLSDSPVAPRGTRKARWFSLLRSLDADVVFVDVGTAPREFVFDALLMSDLPILMTQPEPSALEQMVRDLRWLYIRRLRRAVRTDKFRAGLLERVLVSPADSLSPKDVVRRLAASDPSLAEIAWSELMNLKVQLVVNQTRVRSDVELGAEIATLLETHEGIRIEELGHVEHDDTVWLAARHARPVLIDNPTSKASRNVERIGRKLSMLFAQAETRAAVPPMNTGRTTLYEALGVSRSATPEEVRRAADRAKKLYGPEGLAARALLKDVALERARGTIDEARDVLLDPTRRRAYDLSTFEDPASSPADAEKMQKVVDKTRVAELLSREGFGEALFTGAALRRIREALELELTDVSRTTKIARAHLEAIEDERFEDLPAAVYVRGYVGELAKILRLDPTEVQRNYLRRMRAAQGRKDDS